MERTARVFEDVGGFYYVDARSPVNDTRGACYKSLRSVLAALREFGEFTHWTRYGVRKPL